MDKPSAHLLPKPIIASAYEASKSSLARNDFVSHLKFGINPSAAEIRVERKILTVCKW